jgi:ubiquinone/menaquinone biosynthesis C-methylase UbiE
VNLLKESLRSIVKDFTPSLVIRGIRNAQTFLQKRKLPGTEAIFSRANSSPGYLGKRELESFQDQYPFLPDYGYDLRSTERRGGSRAKDILRLPAASTARSYLELGCWDGMVSCFLQRQGKQTTAIDVRSEGFDERVRREGVKMIQMDAQDLQFPDETFDCVFSYDTFEHVPHPDAMLRNAFKVLKKGGNLFLSFGPLYMSPFGQHAYRSITVPYCHLLFPGPVLNDFAVAKGRIPIDFEHVNGWPVARYRELWEAHASTLRSVRYNETLNLAHLDLIRSYPSCFRSKTESFDDLIVESITAVFEKVG